MLTHVLVVGGEARAAAHVLAVDTGRGAALGFLLQQPVHEVEAGPGVWAAESRLLWRHEWQVCALASPLPHFPFPHPHVDDLLHAEGE